MSEENISVRWLGTAGLALTTQGRTLLNDPFFPMSQDIEPWKLSELGTVDAILASHAHFDHIRDLPEVQEQTGAPIYGPEQVGRNLAKKAAVGLPFETPELGHTFDIGPFRITPLLSKHTVFDARIILDTLARCLSPDHFFEALAMLRVHAGYPNGETWAWQIEAAGKTILILGSCGLREHGRYPIGADALFVALQGRSDIDAQAFTLTRRLKPKTVIPFHFDNSFPPISMAVPTEPFVARIERDLPGTSVFVPEYNKEFELP